MNLLDTEFTAYCTKIDEQKYISTSQVDATVNALVDRAASELAAVYAATLQLPQNTDAEIAVVAQMLEAAESAHATQINNIDITAAMAHDEIETNYAYSMQKAQEQYDISIAKQTTAFAANAVAGEKVGVQSLKTNLPTIVMPKYGVV